MENSVARDYRVNIRWSQQDELFVASVVEIPGVMAHGSTREEAAREIDAALENVIEAARETNAILPEPRHVAA